MLITTAMICPTCSFTNGAEHFIYSVHPVMPQWCAQVAESEFDIDKQ